MIIKFRDEDIKQLCNDERIAKRKIGFDNAKKLQKVLTYLAAAINYKQIIQQRLYGFHDLHGDRDGQYAMNLIGGMRIVYNFLDEQGNVTISDNASSIVIMLCIDDYHKG